jgi:hypothetical protein
VAKAPFSNIQFKHPKTDTIACPDLPRPICKKMKKEIKQNGVGYSGPFKIWTNLYSYQMPFDYLTIQHFDHYRPFEYWTSLVFRCIDNNI